MASKRRLKALAHTHQTTPLGATSFIKVHNQLLLSCFITSVSWITCLQAGGQNYSAILFVFESQTLSQTPFLVKGSPKILCQILKKSLGL